MRSPKLYGLTGHYQTPTVSSSAYSVLIGYPVTNSRHPFPERSSSFSGSDLLAVFDTGRAISGRVILASVLRFFPNLVNPRSVGSLTPVVVHMHNECYCLHDTIGCTSGLLS